MLIKNKAIEGKLLRGETLRLELGGGNCPEDGFYSVDCSPSVLPDIVADLSKPLDKLPDRCVEAVYTRHTLEHVPDLCALMNELHRISTDDCTIEIIVPHFSNVLGYSDPTHVRLFGIYSMFYFSPQCYQPARKVPCYYSDASFYVESVYLELYSITKLDRLAAGIIEPLININFPAQEFYERRLARLWHAWQIHFVIRPIRNQRIAPPTTLSQVSRTLRSYQNVRR